MKQTTRSVVARMRAVRPFTWDCLLAASLMVFDLVLLFTHAGENAAIRADIRNPNAFAVLLVAIAVVPMAWRRRAPFATVMVSSVAIVVLNSFNFAAQALPVCIMIGVFTVACYDQPRRLWVALGAIAALLVIDLAFDSPDLDIGGALNTALVLGGAAAFGYSARARRLSNEARIAEADQRAEAAKERAARAVSDERLHLAQELHDVVAHSLSVIAVQAGVGGHVIDVDPKEAKKALDAISMTSRSTLSELRRLLGVLRAETGEKADHAPAPGLEDLPQLAEQVRAAGVPVEVSVRGERNGVPPGVDLSAFRIVQEALTNVLKHAGRAEATVEVGYEPGAVKVCVRDDGRGASAGARAAEVPSSGHGILGMRERVAVYGGTLSIGPRVGGGFDVEARLPYSDEVRG